ncbi:ABC transporter substrate-binding protein [Paenibacillus sp. CCS19]|uniref:ABC transporter substrate-binding protein n=1 Tax=Paenibacillus sp. CCS19 TaxID=3158387 RepID=UPI0025677EB3|nr:ABC transporter substrate-binding protein [Paenibacillus cellulosilyticus]GMK37568.1 ABC transporter substrate-binding protein [Paenibacillus cellulosilyticus]
MPIKNMFLSCLAAVTVWTAVTACSSKADNASEGGGSDTNQDKVTFTVFNGVAGSKDGNTNETTIGRMLEDQTGVNFKLEFLVGDLNTKIGTMIASNDYPDVIIPDAAFEDVMNAGAFIPLDDLIDQYGPNIKRIYGPVMDQMRAKDGKLYYLPISTQVGEFIPDPEADSAFWVQRRVLEEAGYPKVKTLDAYIKLIGDYAAKHKDEDLTGMVSLTDDWRFFTTSNPPMHLLGYPNDGNVTIDPITLEAKTYASSDATKRWLKTLSDLNANGLFDKASFVDNYDQYIAKLTSHKVLGFFDYRWQVQNALDVLKDAARKDPAMDAYNYFPLPITFDANTADAYIPAEASPVTNRGIGITVSANDPARIIQYFDNMLTEENQTLISWGIQGETYEVNDKGRFYRTEEQIAKIDGPFSDKFGFKYYGWNWPSYDVHSTLASGNAKGVGYQPEVFRMSLTEKDKAILDQYGVQTYTEMFAAPVSRPWYPAWGFAKERNSPEQIWETKKDEIARKYFPKMVLSSPDRFDTLWDSYRKELDKLNTAGYEKWTTEQAKRKAEAVTAK